MHFFYSRTDKDCDDDCTLQEFDFINDFGFEEYKDIRQKPLMQHFNHGIEICYVTKGRYEWEVNNNRYLLFPGNGFVTCPWQKHGSPHEVVDLGEIYWLVIKPEIFNTDGSFFLGEWSRFTPDDNKKIGAVLSSNSKHSLEKAQALKLLFEKLARELKDKEFGYYQRVCNIVEEFLINILRIIEGRESRIVENKIWFSNFDRMLRSGLDQKWTLKKMTDRTNIGITALTQRVKENTGYAPANYLIFLRIEKAKKVIKESDASLTDIALECGFYSAQHFSSTFSKWVGKSPGRFRKQYT
jgi:AraC-like DNA-binding protein